MSSIEIQKLTSSLGELLIGSYHQKICLVDYLQRSTRKQIDQRLQNDLRAPFKFQENELLRETAKQIREYLELKRTQFELPLLLIGTEFQKKVWNLLTQIPYGETVSYLDLAKQAGHPKSFRAVANANGANAMSLVIPCHRVIAHNGKLGGYAGGLSAKSKLLELEQNHILFKNQL